MSEEKAVTFSSLNADQKKSALSFGGGAAYLLYEGTGYAILQVAEMLGYEGKIEKLDPDQQKALAESSARALAYLLGEMVSNPLLACLFVLGTCLKDNISLEKKAVEGDDGDKDPDPEPPMSGNVVRIALNGPKCCASWAYKADDMALVRSRGYGPGEGHHPACRHFK